MLRNQPPPSSTSDAGRTSDNRHFTRAIASFGLRLLALASVVLGIATGSPRSAAAQIYWTQTSGPEGGLISAVTVDSSRRLFLGTFAGGVFQSSDQGIHWHPRNAGLHSFHIRDLQSGRDGYVYALTSDAGLYRYFRDDEAFWTPLDTTNTFGPLLSVTVSYPGTILLGTASGIMRSTDHGATWSAANTGLDLSESFAFLSAANKDRLLLGTASHLYSSIDDGMSWQPVPVPAGQHGIRAVLLSPENVLWLGDDAGNLHRSSDLGQNWTLSYHTDLPVYNIVVSRANGHYFLRDRDGFLYRSTNSGTSWDMVDSVASSGDFYPTAIDQQGYIYVGTDFEGMLRSTNDGFDFELVNDNLIANLTLDVAVDTRNTVYAVTEEFVWSSTDKGDSWRRLGLEIGETFANSPIAIDSFDNVYVGNAKGVHLSTDGGETWRQVVGSPHPDSSDQCLVIAVSPFQSIYAGTGHGLWRSRTKGETWERLQDPVHDGLINSLVVGRDGRVYVEDNVGNTFYSTNDGSTWTPIPPSQGLLVATQASHLFRVSNRQLFRSTDEGLNWAELFPRGAAAKDPLTFDVYLDLQNALVVSTDSGIYRSTDDGDSWHSISGGLHDLSATRLSAITRVAQGRNGVYYAASRGQGIYRSNPYLADVGRHAHSPFVLHPNSPNPFAASTELSFELQEPSDVHIQLNNVLGEVVWSEWQHGLQAGLHSSRISGAELASGNYLCTVRTSAGTQSQWITVTK